jgi:hypothetical protein
MMCMSFTIDENRPKKKWLVVENKTLKWDNSNIAPPKGSPW